jgi:tetratricopeptide (TPR) repeat protein
MLERDMPRHSFRLLSGLLVASLCLGAPSQGAAQCADELARKVFEAGFAYYEAGEYEEALRSFLRSYAMCPKPEQQKNIGATHERMGNLSAAIEAYEVYLRTAPSGADDLDAIQVRVSNLRRREATSAPSASATPSAPPPPPPALTPAAAPTPAPPSQPDRTPAVLVLGASGVVAVGSLITGLLALSRSNEAEESCSPRCPDSVVKPIDRLRWTSTALTGVAILGVGVGSFLWWRSGASPAAPTVGARIAPDQAHLGALWRF